MAKTSKTRTRAPSRETPDRKFSSLLGLAHKLFAAMEDEGWTKEAINSLAEDPAMIRRFLGIRMGCTEIETPKDLLRKIHLFKANRVRTRLETVRDFVDAANDRDLGVKCGTRLLDACLGDADLVPAAWKGLVILFLETGNGGYDAVEGPYVAYQGLDCTGELPRIATRTTFALVDSTLAIAVVSSNKA